jgi:hypothetical protein
VTDVDEKYKQLVGVKDISIALELRSESFGQRHFIVVGPDGVLIDVITPVDPEPEFADAFEA